MRSLILGVGFSMRKAHDRLIEWLEFGGYSQSEAEKIANYLVFDARIGDAETEGETFQAYLDGHDTISQSGFVKTFWQNYKPEDTK